MVSNVDCLGSTSCILPQPTNNPKQLKTTFVGVVLLQVKKKPHNHTTNTPDVITICPVFCMQHYFNPTRWNIKNQTHCGTCEAAMDW